MESEVDYGVLATCWQTPTILVHTETSGDARLALFFGLSRVRLCLIRKLSVLEQWTKCFAYLAVHHGLYTRMLLSSFIRAPISN